jgi:hypothetical protein
MTPDQLRDVRHGILIELYRTSPLGRTGARLAALLRTEVTCTSEDVDRALCYLQGRGLVEPRNPETLSAGMEPFWFITAQGIDHCEREKIV